MRDYILTWHWTVSNDGISPVEADLYNYAATRLGQVFAGTFAPEDQWPLPGDTALRTGMYAPHTRMNNTGNIGFVMDGMVGSGPYRADHSGPFDPGPAPLTAAQMSAVIDFTARLAIKYNIPTEVRRMCSHAEVQEARGIQQKTKVDVTWWPGDPTTRPAKEIGDKMRELVRRRILVLRESGDTDINTILDRHKPPRRDELSDGGRPTLRVGAFGKDVVDLQNALQGKGYPVGSVDGHFGSLTRDAVLQMQARNDLTTDGVVGPRTWGVIMSPNVKLFLDEERDVTVSEIRKRGSRGINAADKIKVGAGVVGTTVIAPSAEDVAGFSSAWDLVQRIVGSADWLEIAGLCVIAFMAYQAHRVITARLDDEKNGHTIK